MDAIRVVEEKKMTRDPFPMCLTASYNQRYRECEYLSKKIRAFDIDTKRFLKRLFSRAFQITHRKDSSAIHQDVDFPEFVDGFLHQAFDFRGFRYVCFDRDCSICAELLHDRICWGRIVGKVDDDRSAVA